MPVELTKGQKVSLAKPTGGGLTMVRMGLGWDSIAERGFLGRSKRTPIDLDASCLLLDAGGRLVDQVWFRQLTSKDGAVRHTGDNTTGDGAGDDESIIVDLARVAPQVQTLVFTVNSFTGQDFTKVENAYCRLVDEVAGTEIARYTLTGSGTHTAVVMAKVSRQGPGWTMAAIGAPGHGRTFQDLMPMIVASLA